MPSFAQCSNCGCDEAGTKIYQCGKCGKVFCGVCGNLYTFVLSGCPRCGTLAHSLGRIPEKKSEDSQDDREEEEEDEQEEETDTERDSSASASYSDSAPAQGGGDEGGLGTVLFAIPIGWTIGGLVLWIVVALALSFLLFMTDDHDRTNVIHRDDCWTILFRWSSYIAFPAAIGGAFYSWYRVLSHPRTWARIGVQCVWIFGIILALIILNWIGSFLGHMR